MAELKKNYCYVTYSEETSHLFSLGLMPYKMQDEDADYNPDGLKSFVISVVPVPGKDLKKLKKADDIAAYTLARNFLRGGEGEQEGDSLKGMENFKLTDWKGQTFHGFAYSVKGPSGKKAIEWFASRSALLPSVQELKEEEPPEDMKEAPEEDLEAYYHETSSHPLEELAAIVGVKLKSISKTQKPPKLEKSAPTMAVLPTRKGAIPGVPVSRAKEITEDDIQGAMNILFNAIIQGKIRKSTKLAFTFVDKTGETRTTERKVEEEGEKFSPEIYKGYMGQRGYVNERIDAIFEAFDAENYDTSDDYPSVVLKLVSHRTTPKMATYHTKKEKEELPKEETPKKKASTKKGKEETPKEKKSPKKEKGKEEEKKKKSPEKAKKEKEESEEEE